MTEETAIQILILHPGSMGVTVAASLRQAGHDVAWIPAGRSAASLARAAEAELAAIPSLEEAATWAEVVISVCPPHAADEVARQVAATDFAGTFVDANAVSPSTARAIQAHFADTPVRCVDGGIVGPPARKPGTTRLYLSGSEAARLAAALGGGNLEVIALDGDPVAASALKMAYAAWTKGSAALLLATRAYAASAGVEAALLDAWSRGGPATQSGQDPATQSEVASRTVPPRAWRFVGEMHEIADAFAGADLPEGFHRAAADLYGRLAGFRHEAPEDADEVVRALLAGGDGKASADAGATS